MYSSPIIYKRTKTGAIQTYQVVAEGPVITVTQGQLNGKLQSYKTYCEGKNIGKSNETTPTEQAELEAAAKLASKLKEGYTYDESGEISVNLPMKVKTYQEQRRNVIFPCTSTFKYNGVNGEYRLEDDQLVLYSRGGEIYPPIPHLEPSVRAAMDILGTTSLNGELYIHGVHLQDIQSAVKKPNELTPQLTFVIFALPLFEGTFNKAIYKLQRFHVTHPLHHLSVAAAVPCYNHDEIDSHLRLALSKGYEGTVIYNLDGRYRYNERSSDVFKYKLAQDAEFEVIDYSIDKSGHPVFQCRTTDGNTFSVKPTGTDAERRNYLANIDSYIGAWLTVEFETYSKSGIPLKPVGIRFRQCSPQGDPIE